MFGYNKTQDIHKVNLTCSSSGNWSEKKKIKEDIHMIQDFASNSNNNKQRWIIQNHFFTFFILSWSSIEYNSFIIAIFVTHSGGYIQFTWKENWNKTTTKKKKRLKSTHSLKQQNIRCWYYRQWYYRWISKLIIVTFAFVYDYYCVQCGKKCVHRLNVHKWKIKDKSVTNTYTHT